MSPRVTLGLLAVLLALGGYVYSANIGAGQGAQPASKDKTADTRLEVTRFDDRDVQALTVETTAGQAIVEKDADGNWRLQPSGEPGDRFRINGLISRLATLRATRRFDEPGDLGQYGLTTPTLTATVRLTAGSGPTLLFGARAPAEAGTYAKQNAEGAVFVVSNAIVQDLERLVSEPAREPTPVPTSPPTPAESAPTPTP
jgi:hypothetical protein